MSHTNKNEKGMVLVTVIIFGAILILLGTALLSTSMIEVKSSNFNQRDTQAYFTAKSVAEAYGNKIVSGVEVPEGTYTDNIGDNSYSIDVVKTGNDYILTATGNSKGTEEVVELVIEESISNDHSFQFDLAIFAGEKIVQSGNGGLIEGDVGANTEDITLNDKFNSEKFTINMNMGLSYPDPIMPDPIPVSSSLGNVTLTNQTWDISSSDNMRTYNSLTVNSLTVNTNGFNGELVVDDLIVNGNLDITGNGKLIIYVKNSLVIEGEVNQLTPLNYKRLEIYHYGYYFEKMTNSKQKLCGYLQVENSEIDMTGGGFSGGLAMLESARISMKGNSTGDRIVVYAPKSEILMSGNASLKGNLIGKSIDISGSVYVTYLILEGVNDPFILPGVPKPQYSFAYWK